jgi:hypothetical protein
VPFLKITRDRRGYEYFCLVHTFPSPYGKTRPTTLYWFRSPPNLKVGRQPLDEEVMRALEAKHPDIAFDWEGLRKTPLPPPSPEFWRERRRADKAMREFQASVDTDDSAAPGPAGVPIEPGPSEIGELAAQNGTGEVVERVVPPVEEIVEARPAVSASPAAIGPARETDSRRRRRRRRGRRAHGPSPTEHRSQPADPAISSSTHQDAEEVPPGDDEPETDGSDGS